MRILLIGFIAFFTWSAVSTHFYVCKIKKLCNDQEVIQIDAVNNKAVSFNDSLSRTLIREQAANPGIMTVSFAFDKSEFNPDTATDNYFEKSKAYLDQNNSARLSITGFTDAIGSDEYNQALGFRRAKSLQKYFERKGMINGKIIVESKGEKDPADDNNTISGRANNRRTVITINQ
jgi:outer membrane protein OmpA-like peptidoglycan-associated protein